MVQRGILCLAAVAVALLAGLDAAQAATNQPAALPTPDKAAVAPVPAVSAAPAKCCPERCITYRHHRPCKKSCCGCEAPLKTILQVKDPCVCGCVIDVPLCIPACCKGAPEVCCHRGLLGRQVVEYKWCCGYKVRVVFDRCGDLIVHTYGG